MKTSDKRKKYVFYIINPVTQINDIKINPYLPLYSKSFSGKYYQQLYFADSYDVVCEYWCGLMGEQFVHYMIIYMKWRF